MKIKNNILKHYLRNVYFIIGTAYAGKSTQCKLLAEKYDMYHCEENYNSDLIFSLINEDDQPNLSYFNQKRDWQEYLNRTSQVYADWYEGNEYELAGFEIAELIRVSHNQKVIVDTNMPLHYLREIAEDHQIAIMLSSQTLAVDQFFEREDSEKVFLKEQIQNGPTPDKTMTNFKLGLEEIYRRLMKRFTNSGCFTLYRETVSQESKEEITRKLAEHFKLC